MRPRFSECFLECYVSLREDDVTVGGCVGLGIGNTSKFSSVMDIVLHSRYNGKCYIFATELIEENKL